MWFAAATACGWLPETHLAYFVSDAIDQLDLSSMDEVYGREKRGPAALRPSVDDEVAGLRLLRGCVQFPADHSPARRWILRKSDMVRMFGRLSAASTREAKSPASRHYGW